MSKKYNFFSANSVLESVISILIISVCFLISTIVYNTIINMSKSVSYYKATNKIIELREDIKSSKIYEDKLYDYKDYSILSNIDVDKVKNVIYLEWIIKADYKEFKINEVIPLTYE